MVGVPQARMGCDMLCIEQAADRGSNDAIDRERDISDLHHQHLLSRQWRGSHVAFTKASGDGERILTNERIVNMLGVTCEPVFGDLIVFLCESGSIFVRRH